MQIAAVQHDIVWEEKQANHEHVETMLRESAVKPGAFVLLPELGDTGFSFNLAIHRDDDASITWGRTLAQSMGIWLQIGYAKQGRDGLGRNCATIISPGGTLEGTYEKVHPFSFGKEQQYFTGGDALLVRKCSDIAFCPLICYDLRFPELWRLAARAGAEVFTIGASWPAARQAHWRTLIIARAIENQAYVVAVNRTGDDPHLSYAGGSMIVSPTGEILADSGEDPAVLIAEVDPQRVRDWRAQFPALRDVRPGLLGSFTIDSGSADDADNDKSSPSQH
jgi:predicted amidohydrolase